MNLSEQAFIAHEPERASVTFYLSEQASTIFYLYLREQACIST